MSPARPGSERTGAPAAIRAVCFDAADTLIELRESVGETYARIAREHGASLPSWRLDDAFARVLRRSEPMVFPGLVGDEARLRDAERSWWRTLVRSTFLAADGTARFADFEAFFEALWCHFGGAQAWRLRAHARAALSLLSQRGHPLGIVSNFDQRLPNILEELGIDGFFRCVILPGQVGSAKPDGAPFRAALCALGTPAARTAYVGHDPERDAAGARAAGLVFVDVRAGAGLEDLAARLEALATLGRLP